LAREAGGGAASWAEGGESAEDVADVAECRMLIRDEALQSCVFKVEQVPQGNELAL
jgi:hypothetical protein